MSRPSSRNAINTMVQDTLYDSCGSTSGRLQTRQEYQEPKHDTDVIGKSTWPTVFTVLPTTHPHIRYWEEDGYCQHLCRIPPYPDCLRPARGFQPGLGHHLRTDDIGPGDTVTGSQRRHIDGACVTCAWSRQCSWTCSVAISPGSELLDAAICACRRCLRFDDSKTPVSIAPQSRSIVDFEGEWTFEAQQPPRLGWALLTKLSSLAQTHVISAEKGRVRASLTAHIRTSKKRAASCGLHLQSLISA